MRAKAAALTAVWLLSLAGAAHAHTVVDGIGGFRGGLLHPLLVPAHALALVGLGCLTGKMELRARLAAIAVFVAATVCAVMLIRLAFSAANPELVVLALAGLSGLLLAAGLHVPWLIVAILMASAAMAIVFDSVPAVLSVQDTLLSLGGTSVAATGLLAVIAFLSALGPRLWQQIGVRILGSWIAASAIMVLALRLAA